MQGKHRLVVEAVAYTPRSVYESGVRRNSLLPCRLKKTESRKSRGTVAVGSRTYPDRLPFSKK